MDLSPAAHGANGAASPEQQPVSGPILSESGWLGRLPPARAHVAVVVVYFKGDHQVLWPHDRQRVLLHRRPATVYEVDVGLRHTVIPTDLPSKGHAGTFHAIISIQWRVLDPSAVVRHRVADVREALSPHLLHRARGITRSFSIAEAAAAEDEINTNLAGFEIDTTAPGQYGDLIQQAVKQNCLGAEYGLWTRGIAELTLDEAAVEHNVKMMKLNWAIEEELAEQKLRLLQEKNQQQITADRIAVYRAIIAADDADRFALQLASNPQDIAAIAAIIREDELTSRRETIDFVAHMVDSGVIERWEVSDQAREALQWLKQAIARVIHDREHQADFDPAHQQRRGRPVVIEGDTEPQPSPADTQPSAGPRTTDTLSGEVIEPDKT